MKRPTAGTVLLIGLGLWLFRDALFFGGVFFKRDVHLVWHSQVEGFVRAVWSGTLPVWDPSLAFGQPLLGDPSAQIAYPLTWLNLLMRPWAYYTLFAVFHFLLTAFGMRALARHLGLSTLGSTVATVAWVLSGPYLSMVDLWHHYAGASWLPWVVLSADRALGGGRRETAVFGAVLALQIVAGSADMCAMSLLLAGAFFVAHHFDGGRPGAPAGLRALGRGTAGLLLAVGASALLWMPALDLVSRASRSSLPLEVRTYWSLHPWVALETVLPGLFSTQPLSRDLRAAFFESREPFLASLYLGVGVVALAVAAVAASRHALRVTLLVVAVLALLVSLGSHTPVYGFVTTLFPPLRILRYPVKMSVLVASAVALLAGLGADAWRDLRGRALAAVGGTMALVGGLAATLSLAAWLAPEEAAARFLNVPKGVVAGVVLRPTSVRLLVTTLLAAVVLALVLRQRAGLMEPGRGAAAIAVLALADLAFYHRSPNPVSPVALYKARPEVLEAIGDRDRARVYVYDYSIPGKTDRYLKGRGPFALAHMPEGWTLEAASALGMQMSLASESAGRWGLSQAFTLDYRGLHAGPLARLAKLLRDVEETPAHLRLLRAGGVTHAISFHPLEDLEPVRTIEGLFELPLLVSRVPEPLPRCFVVGASRRADDDQAVSLLLDEAFPLGQDVVLADGESRQAEPGFRGTCRVAEARAARLTLETELSAPGHVVLLDTWDPGWRVRVDGQEATLLRANLAFRAVALREGRHRVELAYRPRGLSAGRVVAAISIACLALLFGLRKVEGVPG